MTGLKLSLGILCTWMLINSYILESMAITISTSILDGNVQININNKNQITIRLNKGRGENHVLSFGQNLHLEGEPKWAVWPRHFKVSWKNGIQLYLFGKQEKSGVKLLKTTWKAPPSISSLKHCINFGKYNWYGGPETNYQRWPIQTIALDKIAYLPGYHNLGGVIAPYFLSSASISYILPPTNPLFVSIGTEVQNAICLTVEYKNPYINTKGRPLVMDIDMTWNDPPNMLKLWKSNSLTHFGYPEAIPSMKMALSPIWSSWVTFKTRVNQKTFLNFTEEIYARGFPASQMELDDNWESCYGDEEFSKKKFPDPSSMMSTIKKLGFDVTLWIHPFINSKCSKFSEGDQAGYFVKVNGTNVTGRTHWWEGDDAGIIDITNPSAADWWEQRLRNLSANTGITSFKFDAGEATWLPKHAYLTGIDESIQPGSYTTLYGQFANRFGSQVECRVGYFTQRLGGIYQRILDRGSVWGLNNGLHSVITTSLQFGIVGYPFVLPDYIGGNAYNHYPSRELFIRWVELTAFLPVMQFSILPWSYDEEVANISRKMISLHQNIFNVIEAAANQSLIDGSPIIRPVWWIDCFDVTAQKIDDEFLVGSTFLVAPIVHNGSYSRDVYIVKGTWTDMLRGGNINGPKWLYNYSVALDEIAYFKNVQHLD
ncbi:hypothetical protein CHUAL_006842 [Chamberlinius hualienensis]